MMSNFVLIALVVSVIAIAGCVQQTQPEKNNNTAEPSKDAVKPPAAVNQTTEPLKQETQAEKPAEQPIQEPADKRPDLAITEISSEPKLPLVNELVTFTATVKNSGYSDVSSFSYTLSPLVDQVTIVSPASIQSQSLAPGDITTIRMQAKIATPGPAKIKATVDSFNKINESNETNNQIIVPFRIYTKQGWAGCSGNGKSVCADLVDDAYFASHSECQPAYNCTSFVTGCDAACPFPR